MKIIEVSGGLPIMISNEENALVEKIKESTKMRNSSLDEREQQLARNLVGKGVLNRIVEDKKIYFTYNALEQIWRF